MRVTSFSVCHLIHILRRTKILTSWSSIPTGGGFISAHALTKLVKTVGGIAETNNFQDFTIIIYRYQYTTNLPTCYKTIMITSILKNTTRQAISMFCNDEVCSCNYCFNGQVLHILSLCFSLRYPACNTQVPYCNRWPARLYKLFFHIIS